jgi:hypothetical protein
LAHIAESLRSLAIPCKSIDVDPKNARKHGEQNLSAIRASLRVYGQRKPIVVNRRTNIVEAGSGSLVAARELGWSHIAAVFVDDDPMTAAGFAIADNRTAELAECITTPFCIEPGTPWKKSPARAAIADMYFKPCQNRIRVFILTSGANQCDKQHSRRAGNGLAQQDSVHLG